MKTRFFFVIYFHNEVVKTVLDGMRILADPLQRNFSHITVKGPYRNIQRKRLSEDSKLIQGKEIKVSGAGNFFIEKQNTVFLRCQDRKELYDIWKTKEEKTYKNFHPHITIYDGDDRAFATKLFQTIKAHNINFSFVVEKLEIYSSTTKQELFNLRERVDYDFLSRIAGFDISKDNVVNLSNVQRISVIDKLCEILEKINNLLDNEDGSTKIGHKLLVEV